MDRRKGAARRGTTKGSFGRAEDAPFWGFVCCRVWQVALPMESLVGLARPFASLQALPFQVAYSLYCPYLCFFRTTASVAANTGSTDLIYCFTCYPTTAFIDSLYFRRDIATGLEWGSWIMQYVLRSSTDTSIQHPYCIATAYASGEKIDLPLLVS